MNEQVDVGLNWFEGFGGEGDRGGANERLNGQVDVDANAGRQDGVDVVVHGLNGLRINGEQVDAGANVGEHGGVAAAVQGGANGEVGRRVEGGRVFRGRRCRCERWGRTVSYTNRARHRRTHRVWDPGGGPHPE